MGDAALPQIPLMQRPDTPVPFGVRAETGEVRPPYQPPAPEAVLLDPKAVQQRGAPDKHLGLVPTLDSKNIKHTGWGIIFASDADPAIAQALDPLIQHRKQQVGNDAYFKIFDGKKGVSKDQTAVSWLNGKGVGLGLVDPDNGVPYHLLIVGSPARIPYEFQYTLDLQWSVGRLDFDTPGEFGAYAKAVVDYETANPATPTRKSAAMWMPANGDLATNLLCNDVGLPFLQKPIGVKQGFGLTTFLATKATKDTLKDIFTGKALDDGKPPAVLFTGSHGLEVSPANPVDQRERQGALVTQEWQPGKPVGPNASFAAADVPDDADLRGTIHVIFACFGGGCPETDNYPNSGAPSKLLDHAIVGRLPQRILAQGALAVIGHIDRAWSFSFQTGSGLPQNQVLRAILEGIMLGLPAGVAMDVENLQWGVYAALLGVTLGPTNPCDPTPAALANLVIARDDARNYALFGDPAVRLRV